MRSLRLILHGSKADSPGLREAVDTMRARGYEISVRVTWESGDAIRYVAGACADDVDVVVAAGGDGTVNEVLNGLCQQPHERRAALAILPLGTANDFASMCAIPSDPLEALRLSGEGDLFPIDVGKANEHFFINVASAGFGAQVTATTPDEMKRSLGGLAYVLTGFLRLLQIGARRVVLKTPDSLEELDLVLAAVGNGRQAGGGFPVTPRALLNDGLLDLMFVTDFPWSDLNVVANELREPNEVTNQYVQYRRLPWLEIEVKDDDIHYLNLDGEPLTESQSIRFEVVSRGLACVLPSTAKDLML